MTAIIAIVIYLTVLIVALAGWLMNLIAVLDSFDTFTLGESIVRIVGICVPIVGAIAGWF